MSTSLLYHAFGLRGYDYVGTQYVSNEVIFHVSPKPDLLRCPVCRKRKVKRRGFSERKLRLSSMGGKLIYVRAKVPRVECLSCGAIRQIETGIAEPRRTYTRSFERLVLDLSQSMTMLDVAQKDCLEKDALKGARWILFKRPENLKDKYDERQRLNQALELNAPLVTAYHLKEDLRQIWMRPDKLGYRNSHIGGFKWFV